MVTKKAVKSSRARHKHDAGKGGEATPAKAVHKSTASNEPETFTTPPDTQLDDRDIGQYTGQGTPSQQKK